VPREKWRVFNKKRHTTLHKHHPSADGLARRLYETEQFAAGEMNKGEQRCTEVISQYI